MTLVVVGGSDPETAVHAFDAAGFESRQASSLADVPPDRHVMIALGGDVAAELRSADDRGIRYLLVHVGPDDGVPGGSFARAHHRVGSDQLLELARRVMPRDRMLIRCVAFGFKRGLPADGDWVVDVRFLDNPYWVEELRELDGGDERVRRYVLEQSAATELLDNLERTIAPLLPRYRRSGRSQLVIAFGCTGGRHRSVVMAREMARRLRSLEGIEVEPA